MSLFLLLAYKSNLDYNVFYEVGKMTSKGPLKKLNVYFQVENEQSNNDLLRLENVAKITGWSVSAVARYAIRIAVSQVEEQLIEPEQLLKMRKKK